MSSQSLLLSLLLLALSHISMAGRCELEQPIPGVTGKEVGLIIVPGAHLPGDSYMPLLRAIQAMFVSNMVEFVQKESVRIIDITQVMLKENHLGFPVSLPPLQVEYSAPASGCSLEPVPSDLVTNLDVTGNQLTRAESPLVSLLQSYPTEEAMALSDLMNVDGTTHLSPCSCTTSQPDTNTTEGQLMVKELKGARCLDGRHNLVARGSYCRRLAAITGGGGGFPLPEPEPGAYSSNSLVAAGLISGLLSALIAALAVAGICCFINRGSTSSRSVSPAVSPKNGTALQAEDLVIVDA